jgi:hypothetical protein
LSTILDALRKAQAGRGADGERNERSRTETPASAPSGRPDVQSPATDSAADEFRFETTTAAHVGRAGSRRPSALIAAGVAAVGLALGLFVARTVREHLGSLGAGEVHVASAEKQPRTDVPGKVRALQAPAKSQRAKAAAAGASTAATQAPAAPIADASTVDESGAAHHRAREPRVRVKSDDAKGGSALPPSDGALPASPVGEAAAVTVPAATGVAPTAAPSQAGAGAPTGVAPARRRATMGPPLPPALAGLPQASQPGPPPGDSTAVAASGAQAAGGGLGTPAPMVTAAAQPPAAGAGEPPANAAPESAGTVLEAPPSGAPEVSLLFIKWSRDVQGRVASLRGPGGKLLLVHEGDIVEGMRVAAIRPDGVELQWRGSNFLLLAAR